MAGSCPEACRSCDKARGILDLSWKGLSVLCCRLPSKNEMQTAAEFPLRRKGIGGISEGLGHRFDPRPGTCGMGHNWNLI